jgi:hypothetical protein
MNTIGNIGMTHKKQGGKKDTIANDNMTHEQIMGKDKKSSNPKDRGNSEYQSDQAEINSQAKDGIARPSRQPGG